MKVTAAQVAQNAGSVNILNAFANPTAFTTTYASAVAGNTDAAGAYSAVYGTTSVASYFALHAGTVAIAQMNGNNVWISSAWVNGMMANDQSAMLLHEFVHQISSQTDDVIQAALGLATNRPSDNITQKLKADCF